MKVSKSELDRGVVFWTNPELLVELHAKTRDQSDSPTIQRLADPTGSLAPWPPRDNAVFQPVATSMNAAANPGQVYWIRADDEGLEVLALDVASKSKMTMAHVLGWGIYHRHVVFVPHLQWEDEIAFVYPDLVVRFTNTYVGQRVKPIATLQGEGDEQQMIGMFSPPGVYAGRFIEITAGVSDTATADSRSKSEELGLEAASITSTIWGSLILALGENAVGSEVVQSVVMHGHRTDGLVTVHDISLRRETDVHPAMSQIDQSLEIAVHVDNSHVRSALRWYARGRQEADHRDKLLAFHHGIEAIVRRYGKESGLTSKAASIAADEQLQSTIALVRERYSNDAVNLLLGRMKDPQPSIREYVDHYCERHDLSGDLGQQFSRLSRLRNPATHGGSGTVSGADSKAAQELLELFIRTEMSSG
jgi:hypothetical protein